MPNHLKIPLIANCLFAMSLYVEESGGCLTQSIRTVMTSMDVTMENLHGDDYQKDLANRIWPRYQGRKSQMSSNIRAQSIVRAIATGM